MLLSLVDKYYKKSEFMRKSGLRMDSIKTLLDHKLLKKIKVNSGRKGERIIVKEFQIDMSPDEFNKLNPFKFRLFIQNIQQQVNKSDTDKLSES